jgi:hypothetical protein
MTDRTWLATKKIRIEQTPRGIYVLVGELTISLTYGTCGQGHVMRRLRTRTLRITWRTDQLEFTVDHHKMGNDFMGRPMPQWILCAECLK